MQPESENIFFGWRAFTLRWPILDGAGWPGSREGEAPAEPSGRSRNRWPQICNRGPCPADLQSDSVLAAAPVSPNAPRFPLIGRSLQLRPQRNPGIPPASVLPVKTGIQSGICAMHDRCSVCPPAARTWLCKSEPLAVSGVQVAYRNLQFGKTDGIERAKAETICRPTI